VPPFDRAGWFEGRAKPGETGTAVIAAPRRLPDRPAYRLEQLAAGDTVTVEYDDGTSVGFVVRGSDRFLESGFPTERVYGATIGSVLRLLTCGGSFDRRTRSYEENLVVLATAAWRQGGREAARA